MKITIKEIIERYRVDKSFETRLFWTSYAQRPISFYLAWLCLKLGLSANKVTLMFFGVGVVACLFFGTGDYTYMIIGAALLEFSFILDCVDGHIARLKGSTYLGQILDLWSGNAIMASSMFALGIGLSKNHELLSLHLLHSIFPTLSNISLLYVGFFASFVSLLTWYMRNSWRVKVLHLNKDDPDFQPRTRAMIIIENLFAYPGGYAITMLVFAVLHVLDIFLILIMIIYAGSLLLSLHKMLRTAYFLDKSSSRNSRRNTIIENDG